MNPLRLTLSALALASVAALTLTAPAGAAVPSVAGRSAHHYPNCTALNHRYPHGVGRPGAHDHTSGTPVRNFRVDKNVYNANTGSDRDHDGIACEKA